MVKEKKKKRDTINIWKPCYISSKIRSNSWIQIGKYPSNQKEAIQDRIQKKKKRMSLPYVHISDKIESKVETHTV